MPPALARARWFASGAVILVALAVGRWLAPGPTVGDPAISPAPTFPASWSRYAPPDGSFAVMAPGAPAEREQQTDAGLLHRVDFATPEGGTWFVEWLDASAQVVAGRSEAQLIDLVLAPLADRLGAQIDEEDILRDGSHPGAELHLSSSDGRAYLVRVLAAAGRLVEATAEIPVGGDAADAERFVTSLELTDP